MSLPLTKRIEALGTRMLKAQFVCACVLLVALSRDSRDGAWQRFYVVSSEMLFSPLSRLFSLHNY